MREESRIEETKRFVGHFTVHQPDLTADEREKFDSSSRNRIRQLEKNKMERLREDSKKGKEKLFEKNIYEGEKWSEENRCFKKLDPGILRRSGGASR